MVTFTYVCNARYIINLFSGCKKNPKSCYGQLFPVFIKGQQSEGSQKCRSKGFSSGFPAEDVK